MGYSAKYLQICQGHECQGTRRKCNRSEESKERMAKCSVISGVGFWLKDKRVRKQVALEAICDLVKWIVPMLSAYFSWLYQGHIKTKKRK